jgi:serine/threonine protein kinase
MSWLRGLYRPGVTPFGRRPNHAPDPHEHEAGCAELQDRAMALWREPTRQGNEDVVQLDAALPLPARFGSYELLERLGQGGMGVVYRARDMRLGREVALKVMKRDLAADPRSSDRFLREARALAALHHDHVVEIYDYGETNGVRFVTMPLLAGEALETRLLHESPLPFAEVVRLGMELAAGLAAVHAKGLIHRDLKPSNVWLEGSARRVKLLDFGLARGDAPADRLTHSGEIVGTPAYMAPEQVNGLDLDPRTDLFSLGSVLYKAATGRAAFEAPTLSGLLAAVGEKNPPPARTVNPAVPVDLSELIERLHRKNPGDRPASAAEVVDELRGLAAGFEAPTTHKPGPGLPGRRRLRWSSPVRVAVGLALGSTLLFGIIFFALIANRSAENRARDFPSQPVGQVPPDGTTEPLRVRALDVFHLENVDNKPSNPRGSFGKETFRASPEDDIKVTASLSTPAYSYLIIFRPDGKDEVLYPQRSSDLPEKIEEPRYPSQDRSKVYGLTDGTGLWLVALVASQSPLPPYAEWRRQHPGCPWAKADGETDVVWFDDGQWLEATTPRGLRNRGDRGEKQAAGTAPIVQVVDWLKAETGGVVSAVAFTVKARK